MSGVSVDSLSVQSMTALLTAPYRRGAETLVIPLGADDSTGTAVGPYDFHEYRARHETAPPKPRYVIFPLVDTGPDALEIEVDYSFQGQTKTVSVGIPPRSFVETSFVIPIPLGESDAALQVLRFRQKPVPLRGDGADNFGILALLGNISKLTWVLGWEKDQIRQ